MILLCLFFLIASCETKQMETAGLVKDKMPDANPVQASNQNTPQQQVLKDLYSNGKAKLIKTLNYRFEVENVNKTTEAIEAAVKKYPAYISDSKLVSEGALTENKITLRVQNEYFQDLIREIDQQAKVIIHRTITTDDVAREFVDLESRLKTKREVEQRYAEILRKNAGTITELLEAEQKIGGLHEEIEAAVSRINYLKDQVSYSTINLEFYQSVIQQVAEAENDSTAKDLTEGLTAGWNGIVRFLIVLSYIWPLVLVGSIIGALFWFRKRRSPAHV